MMASWLFSKNAGLLYYIHLEFKNFLVIAAKNWHQKSHVSVAFYIKSSGFNG
jgi:hypothetical protein